MERNGWTITLEASSTRARRSRCSAESIRQLVPGQHFGAHLLDVLVGLVHSADTVYLNSEFYSEIQSPHFGQSKEWVLDIACANTQWLLPIHEGDGWKAVRIDWRTPRISYYDSNSLPRSHESRMDRCISVRNPGALFSSLFQAGTLTMLA